MTSFDETRQKLERLASAHPTSDEPEGAEDLTAVHADAAYVVLHAAGITGDAALVFPSVRLENEQRLAAESAQVISYVESEDPAIALEGVTKYPAAVREQYSHADEFPEDSDGYTRWYGFESIDAAQDYVTANGADVEIPGPGEFTGDFWYRAAYLNPHYQAQD